MEKELSNDVKQRDIAITISAQCCDLIDEDTNHEKKKEKLSVQTHEQSQTNQEENQGGQSAEAQLDVSFNNKLSQSENQ